MKTKPILLFILSIAVSLFFTACSKKESDQTKTENAKPAEIERKNSEQLESVSKPDLTTPSNIYREMKYAADVFYAVFAIFPNDIDFGKIAGSLSKKYQDEQDSFKKQDIVKSLKSEMEDGLNKAKSNKYYYITFRADRMDIQAYNFEKKSFFNPGLGINQDSFRSYNVPNFNFPTAYNGPYSDANLRFFNVQQFADVKVDDQEVARKIESLRSAGKLSMRVYFFANDINIRIHELIAEITKIEYIDPAGNIVLTQVK